MSKFFNITLNKDIILNDDIIGKSTVWSSEHTMDEIDDRSKNIIDDIGELDLEKTWSNKHISEEIATKSKAIIDNNIVDAEHAWSGNQVLDVILNNRITRLDSLDDVDVVNKKDKQILMYSESLQKFTTIDVSSVGDAAGLSLKQLSKMATTGTPTTPQIVDIAIETIDFKVPKVNVLKFQLGDQNIIKSEATFTNSESNDFLADDMIIFDGTSHLRNSFSYDMIKENNMIGSYQPYSVNLDNIFKSISNLSISDNGITKVLNVSAAPTDRLLISKGDLNLSNIDNIDLFNVTATATTKLICSIDSGVTWKTFISNNWENVNLTVDDVNTKGMGVATFNSVPSIFWNMLVTTHKIRFAYLLQDSNTIDELKIQYDCPGYWLEAKNTEYDVIYASNSLMQVKLYISGDVKINY